MSFSKESFNKKLSILQDTQESIVSISQWVFFHHRHSKECAQAWSDYILHFPSGSSASAKKLCLYYLCNDVVQRAKRKRKPEFIEEFALILPNVISKTYNSLDTSTRPKIDRLINVWQERAVFNSQDIQKMKAAIEDIKAKKDTESSASKNSNTQPSSGEIVSELKQLNELFLSLSSLNDISQSNLTQFGIQSKTYLPKDPSTSEKLPSPKVYISKLNMLEKLSKLSIANIEELKNIKLQIINQLNNLSRLISDQSKTDDTKTSIINEKLSRLYSTREELQSMSNEDDTPSSNKSSNVSEEEPSPTFDHENLSDNADDEDDDLLPTYESDDEDTKQESAIDESHTARDEQQSSLTRKRRASQTPSGGSTPSYKKVAFSEDIEVKEFDREEESNIINIVNGNGGSNHTEYDVRDEEEEEEEEYSVSSDFELHHKDDLELKHDHESATEDDDGYDPSLSLAQADSKESNNLESTEDNSSVDVMSLLSKLA